MTTRKQKEPKQEEESGSGTAMTPSGYNAVYTRLFNGADFNRLTANERLTFLVMRLGPPCTMPCILFREPETIARMAGLRVAEVNKALKTLERDQWIAQDERLIWIIRGFEFQPYLAKKGAENPYHLAGLKKALLAFPRSKLVATFIAYYDLPISYPEPPDHQLLNSIRNGRRDSLTHSLCHSPTQGLSHRPPDSPTQGPLDGPTHSPRTAPPPMNNEERIMNKEESSKEVFPDKADPPENSAASGASFKLPTNDEIENCPTDLICDWCRAIAGELKPIWPKSFSFFSKHVREGRNKRAILLALKQIHQNRPTGDLWGYATQILNIEEGNFNERENHRNKEAHHHDPTKGGD